MDVISSTKYTGLIGHPVGHSISPILHNRIYRKMGLNMVYLTHDIIPEDLGYAINGLKALDYLGFNVTIPYKESVIKYLDALEPGARAIGAVNTVKNVHGRLIGYNTDGIGFMQSLKRAKIECRDKHIVILGAGGAARAIGISLVRENPQKIHIVNRSKTRGANLVRDTNQFANKELAILSETIPNNADIIINTTPIGMWPNIEENPLEIYKLSSKTIVCDIVYNPLSTSMLDQANKNGCTTLNGMGMLVGQGIKALEIWSGEAIDKLTIDWITDELINYMDLHPSR